jgi:hypothetical protein
MDYDFVELAGYRGIPETVTLKVVMVSMFVVGGLHGSIGAPTKSIYLGLS